MLPISIKIKGIYSYQTEQSIDFTELTKDKLFGIFGAVGSGKSAILEAMIIALYKKSERLKEKRGSANYNLMNLKSNELFIDFEFIGGKENKKYRFVTKGKRNAKKFEEVKTLKHDSYTWSEGENDWIPNSLSAEDILGLNYENFKRTIIIPQGQFQEFIQLTENKRGEMLEKIFQLQKFDLGYKIKQLETPNKSAIDHHNGQLLQLENVNSALIDEKVKTEAEISKEFTASKKEIIPLEKALIEQNSFFENIEQFKKTEKEFLKLEKNLFEKEKEKKQLDYFIECKTNFAEDINRIDDLERDFKTENSLLIKLNNDKKELENQESVYKKKVTELEEKHETLATLEIKCNDLEYIKLIKDFNKQIKQHEKNLSEQKELINDFDKNKMQPLSKSIEEAEKANSAETQVDFKKHIKKTDWLREYLKTNTEIKQALESHKKTKNEISKIKEQEGKILEKYLPKNKKRLLESSTLIVDLNTNLKALEDKISTLEKDVIELRAEKKLSDFSVQLKDGEPCKLCGSLQHPHPHTAK